MTRDEFIKKWLGNPDKQYIEQHRNEMLDDLDLVLGATLEQQCNWLMLNTDLSVDKIVDFKHHFK